LIINHFNKSYNLIYNWLIKLVITLKSKFCNFYKKPPSKSGLHMKHELQTKIIKKLNNVKTKIIINNINNN
jgi:hypothetical protein